MINYNLNVEQSLGRRVLAQIGYIGNESRKLVATTDINQAARSPTGSPTTVAESYAQQASRPYFSQFPTYGNINQLSTIANGNYSSLQALPKFADYHGLTAQANCTWGHALDQMSQSRSLLPQNSYDSARNTATAASTLAMTSPHSSPMPCLPFRLG